MRNKLKELRHLLHGKPELSGKETGTAESLESFLRKQEPDELLTGLGGCGILAVYNGTKPGGDVLLRCDMDAVPVREATGLHYSSSTPEAAHACGHDGHMAIMAGVAGKLTEAIPASGRVLLLFQPQEENGAGARKVIEDPAFRRFKPCKVFALHNLPGFPTGSIITTQSTFASASRGLIINLTGKSSHAGEPQLGISPAPAVASLISGMERLCRPNSGILVTLIHVKIGEIAFGTSPGDAVVMVTLRAPAEGSMERLSSAVLDLVRNTASKNSLELNTHWTEEFPATVNTSADSMLVCEAAHALGLETIKLTRPFPWSEDFGHFTAQFGGAMFGLGAGIETPPLHSPEYDFPDVLIQRGIEMYINILERITGFD